MSTPRRFAAWRLSLLPALIVVAASPTASVSIAAVEGAARFDARLADGRRVEGNRLHGWARQGGDPKLDDTPLLGDNPLQWLVDRDKTPPPEDDRGPCLELWQGDVLPGEVMGYVPRASLPAEPGHLLVLPAAELQPPPSVTEAPVRVIQQWVRRIVFEATSRPPLKPGSLRFRNGHTVRFRSLRFEPGQVVALTSEGRVAAAWSQLSELHLPPPTDVWDVHWQQRVVLSPDAAGRLLELETSDHLRVTTSFQRLEHRALSNDQDSESWVHGVQPAWSLDALWVPSRNVWLRVSYRINELPLSRLEPAGYEHRPMVGVVRPWRRDRSVDGAPLLSGGEPHGWGLGTHSHSRIDYQLPASASRLSVSVGLDATAGSGGCVRARVRVGNQLVRETGHLIGAAAFETLDVDLTVGREETAMCRLGLEIDAAHDGRPAAADPLDIRDQTNWLDPLVIFDESWVRGELSRRTATLVEAWSQWNVWTPGEMLWTIEWDKLAPPPGAFKTRLETPSEVLLQRRLRRRPSQRFLMLSVTCANADTPVVLEVHGGGQLLQRVDVPERSQRRPVAPLIVAPLDSLPEGEETDLVVAVSSSQSASLSWEAATVVAAHPEYHQLYDDQPHPQAVEDRDRSYTGRRCLRLSPGHPYRVTFGEPKEFRYRPESHQCRYLRFAVASPTQGMLAVAVKVKGEAQPHLYDLGQGPLTEGRAKRIIPQPLANNWLLVTRDVCGDVQEADVEYVEFFVPAVNGPDKDVVLLDQAFIGRGGGGAWNELPSPLGAPWNIPLERQRLVDAVGPRAGAFVVAISYEDGRTTEGVLVDSEHVLTVAESMPTGGQPTLTLADGRQAKGDLLGIRRDANWGLIRWTGEKIGGPRLARNEQRHMLFNSSLVHVGVGGAGAAAVQGGLLPSEEIEALDAAALKSPVGRALLSASGQLIGLRTSRDEARYVRLVEFGKSLGALKEPKRDGRWRFGQGPTLGLDVQWSDLGAVVSAVQRGAAAAGLRAGDRLVEVNGRPVRDAWSLHQAVADRDPGEEVAAKHVRDGKEREVVLRLGFR